MRSLTALAVVAALAALAPPAAAQHWGGGHAGYSGGARSWGGQGGGRAWSGHGGPQGRGTAWTGRTSGQQGFGPSHAGRAGGVRSGATGWSGQARGFSGRQNRGEQASGFHQIGPNRGRHGVRPHGDGHKHDGHGPVYVWPYYVGGLAVESGWYDDAAPPVAPAYAGGSDRTPETRPQRERGPRGCGSWVWRPKISSYVCDDPEAEVPRTRAAPTP